MSESDKEPGHHAVRREYERAASRYEDRWRFYVETTAEETIKRLPLAPGDRVLDVACGTGTLIRRLAGAEPGIDVTGVDVTWNMLRIARMEAGRALRLVQASAEALPFASASFDTVICANAFHYFREPETALAEMRRVLAGDGTLVVTDWCDDYLACRVCDRLLRVFDDAHVKAYGLDECENLVEAAGFDDVAAERYRISWLWGMMTARARRST